MGRKARNKYSSIFRVAISVGMQAREGELSTEKEAEKLICSSKETGEGCSSESNAPLESKTDRREIDLPEASSIDSTAEVETIGFKNDSTGQEASSSEAPKLSKNAQKRLIKKALLEERRKAKKLAKKEQKAARKSAATEGDEAPPAAKRPRTDDIDNQHPTEPRSSSNKKEKEDFDSLRLAGQVQKQTSYHSILSILRFIKCLNRGEWSD